MEHTILKFPANENSIEFTSSHGTTFTSDRADLRGGVQVSNIHNEPTRHTDYSEFAYWHALTFHPFLNGFQGYDCIRYEEVSND